jgi:hypothetical protein
MSSNMSERRDREELDEVLDDEEPPEDEDDDVEYFVDVAPVSC